MFIIMRDGTKTSRKNFLKRSGLTIFGGFAVLGGIFSSKKSFTTKAVKSSGVMPAMSRISPEQRAVVRKEA